MILPTSRAFLSSPLITIPHPVASGGSGDVYEGILDGSKVYVKCIRVHANEDVAKVTKVHYPTVFPVCRYL